MSHMNETPQPTDQITLPGVNRAPNAPRFQINSAGVFTRRETSYRDLRPAAIDINAIPTETPSASAPPTCETAPHSNPSGAREPERGARSSTVRHSTVHHAVLHTDCHAQVRLGVLRHTLSQPLLNPAQRPRRGFAHVFALIERLRFGDYANDRFGVAGPGDQPAILPGKT